MKDLYDTSVHNVWIEERNKQLKEKADKMKMEQDKKKELELEKRKVEALEKIANKSDNTSSSIVPIPFIIPIIF